MYQGDKIAAVGVRAVVLLLAATNIVACSQEVGDSIESGSAKALTASADVCGERCGNAVLATGQGCCRSGGPETAYDTSSQCCTSGVQTKYPIKDLNACPSRVSHSDPPTVNGCSVLWPLVLNAATTGLIPIPGSILIQGTLEASLTFFAVAFTNACNQHDVCYGACSLDPNHKAHCDDQLLGDSVQICKTNPLLRKGPFHGACMAAAQTFHKALGTQTSVTFFEGAQRGADGHGGCDCCAGDASCLVKDADLAVSAFASPGPGPVDVSQHVQFQFTVVNNGPGPASNVTGHIILSGNLSAGAAVYSVAPSASSSPCSTAGNEISCAVGVLRPGEVATLEGSATAASPGNATASASMTSAQTDPAPSNNTVVATWTVACPSGTSWNATTLKCEGTCPSDWQLVPRDALSLGPNGTGGGGLLANYSDGTVVSGEGPIWFGPHDAGYVPSWYPADRLADASAPPLWQTIWGIGGETLTGYILAPRTGAVEFLVGCDDYCSIDIPGQVSGIEDNTRGSTGGVAQLQAGAWYPITLGYQNRWGSNGFDLFYRCP
jgi:hypothetical protein